MTEQPPNPFVHLHVHTEFSLLDGLSKIKSLVKRAKALEMPALAITDHGTMYGVQDFYNAAMDAKIQPILGMEGYLARRGMKDKDPNLDKRPFHLLLLARNYTGYRNLLKIASAAQLEGYYYRPRIDVDFLEKHAEGIVATTGCLAAKVPQFVMADKQDEAREWIGRFSEIFGPDNFYMELQHHDVPVLGQVNKWLIDYARSGKTPVKLVATNDVHYILKEDYDAHDTLLCIQTTSLKSQPKRSDGDDEAGAGGRMAMSDNSYYLTSAEEMWHTFADVPEALTNTLEIAERCAFTMPKREYHFPKFPVPSGFTPQSYLRHLCEIGMEWRFGERKDDPVLRKQLDYELDVIDEMGFNTYFLIVWDLCEYARHADIWFNVRGSGAGSLALYALGITNIDPIQNVLFFERFLNPERKTMPDIDIDYPDDRRAEMMKYSVQKYGSDKVAAIITFGTLGAKQAVRDVARTMDFDLNTVNKALKFIPQEPKPKPVAKYVEDNPDLKEMVDSDPALRDVMDMAGKLQGARRHTSVHAAGVIIADQDLREYLPLHRVTGKENADLPIKQVTQFTMETCEAIGLLKIDFLGLATLTILRTACELVNRYHGTSYSMDNIPYRRDDPSLTDEQREQLVEAYRLIARGDTVGVFQLESSGMQQMLRDMRPFEFENIVAAVSLYRPGPMDYIPDYNKRLHGEEAVEYLHPKLEAITSTTYGILVYQEQIMQIARDLFGYKLGEADLMRRAVSKKKEEDLAKHRAIFKERGPAYGVPEEVADRIFDQVFFFANYGFNKAHAADYAVLSVQTAFMKAHYPEEYMAALLTVQVSAPDKLAVFLEECRRLHIPILPPDINSSDMNFTIEEGANGRRGIRFGLVAIKGAGEGALHPILDERAQNGRFVSLQDLAKRVDLRRVGKRTVEALAQVGGFDSLHNDRQQLFEQAGTLVEFSGREHDDAALGQMNMFGALAEADSRVEFRPVKARKTQRELLMWEKELLGVYVSGRPIDKFRRDLRRLNSDEVIRLKEDAAHHAEQMVKVAGEIVSMRKVFTKKQEAMAILQVEDWHETAAPIEIVLFPRTFAQIEALVESGDLPALREGEVLVFTGKFDMSRGDPQIICERVSQNFELMEAARPASAPAMDDYTEGPQSSSGDEPDWSLAPRLHEQPPDDPGEPVRATGTATTTMQMMAITDDLPDDAPDWMRSDGSGNGHVPRWIVVTLERSGDIEADVKILRNLHRTIFKFRGIDHFLVRAEVNGMNHWFTFDDLTDCSEPLLARLSEIVRPDQIQVLDRAPEGVPSQHAVASPHGGTNGSMRRHF